MKLHSDPSDTHLKLSVLGGSCASRRASSLNTIDTKPNWLINNGAAIPPEEL